MINCNDCKFARLEYDFFIDTFRENEFGKVVFEEQYENFCTLTHQFAVFDDTFLCEYGREGSNNGLGEASDYYKELERAKQFYYAAKAEYERINEELKEKGGKPLTITLSEFFKKYVCDRDKDFWDKHTDKGYLTR